MKKIILVFVTIIVTFLGVNKLKAYTSSTYTITDYVVRSGSSLKELNKTTYGNYNMFVSVGFLDVANPLQFTFGFSLSKSYSNYDYFIFSGLSNGSVSSASGCETISNTGSVQYVNGLTPFTIKCYIGDLSSFNGNYQHLNYSINYPQNSSTNVSAVIYLYNTIYLSNESDQQSAVQISIDNLNNTQQETNNKLDDLNNTQQETNNKLDDLNDNLTNDNVNDANNSANDFFGNFEDNDYGLSDIVKMPLQFINNITSATCTPLSFPLPFVDTNVTLPCMYNIYQQHFGNILQVYQTITFGMVAYWVCINLFRMVKNFKNPDSDEVEVLDL